MASLRTVSVITFQDCFISRSAHRSNSFVNIYLANEKLSWSWTVQTLFAERHKGDTHCCIFPTRGTLLYVTLLTRTPGCHGRVEELLISTDYFISKEVVPFLSGEIRQLDTDWHKYICLYSHTHQQTRSDCLKSLFLHDHRRRFLRLCICVCSLNMAVLTMKPSSSVLPTHRLKTPAQMYRPLDRYICSECVKVCVRVCDWHREKRHGALLSFSAGENELLRVMNWK